jgi:hypothetical protein
VKARDLLVAVLLQLLDASLEGFKHLFLQLVLRAPICCL